MFDHFDPPPVTDPGPLATLVDVTLRDGGFEVDFRWPDTQFADVTAALAPVGVEIVELGYLGGVPLEHAVVAPGIGAHLTPEHVATAQRDGVRLAAMVHPSALAGEIDLTAYTAAGLHMLRLVYHPHWLNDLAHLAHRARDHGLLVSVNIALASRYDPDDLLVHAARIDRATTPDVLYLADTCGAFLPGQVTDLITRLRATVTADLGFHAHDFLSLAYANALAAAAAGATYLDCSILGLGRGGGNLQAELVLVRHRLRDRPTPSTALAELLACRRSLAALAHRPVPSLVPLVCGALNLTPVEEHALAELATAQRINPDAAALWLASATSRVASLRTDDLVAAWLTTTGRA